MLQVSTGKFFRHEAYETLRRAIFYTNYRIFHDDVRLETLVGSLQPAFGAHGLGRSPARSSSGFRRYQEDPILARWSRRAASR